METLTGRERTQAIAQELHRLCPNGVAPLGMWVEVGKQFGVTRERVRQIAVIEGITNTRKDPNAKQRRCFCVKCGAPTQAPGVQCIRCRKIEVPCAQCGKPVVWSERTLKRRTGSTNLFEGKLTTYTGRVFCDRSCAGRFAGLHTGFGVHRKVVRYDEQFAELMSTGRCVFPGDIHRAGNFTRNRLGPGRAWGRSLGDGTTLLTLKP